MTLWAELTSIIPIAIGRFDLREPLVRRAAARWSGGSAKVTYNSAGAGVQRCEWSRALRARENEAIMSTHVSETPLEQFQRRMVFYQRQAALGSMLGTVVHEFNNLLSTALNRTEMAATSADATHRRKCLNVAIQHMQKMDRLAKIVAEVARGDETRAQACAVAELVNAAVVATARPLEKDQIELELRIAEDLQILAQPLLFEQVILNLVLNARKAMKGRSGKLSIVAARDGDTVVIDVRDSGTGIPADVLDDLINPFLASDANTQPGDWCAVGLGLNACRTIAQRHGASICASTNDGRGCTFRLRWPSA